MSVLADIPRQATVKCQTPCLLISISRPNFRNLIKVAPDVGESVHKMMCLYALSKLFHCVMYTQTLSNIDKKTLELKLLPTCTLLEIEADVSLIKEDDAVADFYFLYHGRAVATTMRRDDDHGSNGAEKNSCNDEVDAPEAVVPLGVLGPGSYFGEISIITGTPCRATISTLSRWVVPFSELYLNTCNLSEPLA